MKWYHWAGIAVVVLWMWTKRKRGGHSYAPPAVTPTDKVVAIANDNFPGGAGSHGEIREADQNLYPGFYITADGGYVNPSTGEFYSPGTSPVSSGWTPEWQAQHDRIGAAIGDAIKNHAQQTENVTHYVEGESNVVY
jgi:hypothetical protein